MQLRAVGRRFSTGSATVLGDIAQGTTAVGDPVVGRDVDPSRPAGRRPRDARPRLPGARRGHRLRGPAAALDRARDGPADVRARRPGTLETARSAPPTSGRAHRRRPLGARRRGFGRRHRARTPTSRSRDRADRGGHRAPACPGERARRRPRAPPTPRSARRTPRCRSGLRRPRDDGQGPGVRPGRRPRTGRHRRRRARRAHRSAPALRRPHPRRVRARRSSTTSRCRARWPTPALRSSGDGRPDETLTAEDESRR